MPGVGKYQTTNYDEKFCKKIRGGAIPTKADGYNYVDEAMTLGKESPGFYNDVPLVSIYFYLSDNFFRKKLRGESSVTQYAKKHKLK